MKINNLKKLIKSGSIHLKNSTVIEIIGDQDKVFDLLQGQVTSDITTLENGQSQLSCICNHKGMIMADFIIIRKDENYKFIVNKNIEDILIKELTPFAKFSAVKLLKSNLKVIGTISHTKMPNSFLSNKLFSTCVDLKETHKNENEISKDVWDACNKLLGNYFLEDSDISKFRPLELNYDELRVSFDKGCYRGQEIVARMRYLGVNRRKFLTFVVNDDYVDSEDVKLIGNKIKINKNYIFNGIILRDQLETIKNLPGIELIS